MLAEHLPHVEPTLHFNNSFELLIAVILSAQCTDKQVNRTTADLFEKYKTPRDFAVLPQQQLADDIKGCGLYRNKSLHIIKTCKILTERYGGKVPNNFNDLQALPGVGRKTANVVLNLAFGKPTFPVDTHVYRVARRMGLSYGNTPRRVEKDLLDLIPANERGVWHHRIIHFGRSVCTARTPHCADCVVAGYCLKTKKQTHTLDKEN
ncbi:endonuclease III [Desulfoscipio sp. XC116]|uniref:endonuclease III n=1 Tax=Desulfoscipio sp. XC116 TaxID=3144975 RepID=UPI00325AB4EB